ncbi:hypothetical protein [Vitiosangium sp. GDMCC 1.1324]|uniref:hypothetical protein n=1 Tax=Vitiosangium sp. (strain GDMCC 1.1324) TaxID=2138576 RepID=UPI000D38BCFF|nr:hypothetical protein [Vitiosangium sp. GDMCC 1.1324]PTL83147.1 hypothetical protein DAT35_14155 [Vitiosangium sp. GDMCC 1.1324]
MRFKKLGEDAVGESESLRTWDPVTGLEQINPTDQELAMSPPLDEEPDHRDILPDQIHEFRRGDEEEKEEEITARPHEPLRPIPLNDMPEG